MEQQVEEPAPVCVHHWILENGKAARLSREAIIKHPNCIGRLATCKKCSVETVHFEKVWDQAWRD